MILLLPTEAVDCGVLTLFGTARLVPSCSTRQLAGSSPARSGLRPLTLTRSLTTLNWLTCQSVLADWRLLPGCCCPSGALRTWRFKIGWAFNCLLTFDLWNPVTVLAGRSSRVLPLSRLGAYDVLFGGEEFRSTRVADENM